MDNFIWYYILLI